ncbi:MAG: siroheme decarboxylase subunit alpha, partial [Acidimicrobiia bacterium]
MTTPAVQPPGETRPEAQLDDVDKELLNAVQWDFPLVERPYAALADRLGITEAEVLDRLAKVKELGVLRQLSAIYDTRALGYSSALVAAKLDPDHIDAAAAIISAHPGVSHNYKRNHEYNLWYTLATPPGEDFDAHLDVLHTASGAHVTRKLPTLVLYKIGVKLDMTGATSANAKAEVLAHEQPERRPDMQAPELSDLEIAAISVLQDDLPLVEEPFAAQGARIGVDGATVLELLQSFKDRKLMRRVARDGHAQAPDARALQDRREARHDRCHERQREGGGARTRTAGTPTRHAGARPLRS